MSFLKGCWKTVTHLVPQKAPRQKESYGASLVRRLAEGALADTTEPERSITTLVIERWNALGVNSHATSLKILQELSACAPDPERVRRFEHLLTAQLELQASPRHWTDVQRMAQLCTVVLRRAQEIERQQAAIKPVEQLQL